MDENEIARIVVDSALKIHRALGPGLLESVYEAVLANELRRRGLNVLRQQPVTIQFESMAFDDAFKADLIVENLVILELKSVETVLPVHKKQLLTYLKLANKRLGLLINFNCDLIKDGITRVANGMPDAPKTHEVLCAFQ